MITNFFPRSLSTPYSKESTGWEDGGKPLLSDVLEDNTKGLCGREIFKPSSYCMPANIRTCRIKKEREMRKIKKRT